MSIYVFVVLVLLILVVVAGVLLLPDYYSCMPPAEVNARNDVQRAPVVPLAVFRARRAVPGVTALIAVDPWIARLANINAMVRRLREMHVNVQQIDPSGDVPTLSIAPVPGRSIAPLLDMTAGHRQFVPASRARPARMIARLDGVILTWNIPGIKENK